MSSTITQGPLSIEQPNTDIGRQREYNDPQTIFYLIPTVAGSPPPQDILTTLYFWATRIENTVREQGNQGKDIQAGWDRGAYRPRLLDHVTRTTPWLMVISDGSAVLPDEVLTGEYDNDKQIYQKAVREFVQAKLPEIPTSKLRIIENYITETMVLGQETLIGALRFGLAFPLSGNTGSSAQSGLRVLTFTFEKITGDRTMMRVSQASYQTGLNRRIFDSQNFNQQDLDRGKALVLNATFEIVP